MGEALGILSGMNFGRSIPSMFNSDISKPRKLGQFFSNEDRCLPK